jgi:hypothetical protein
MTRLQSIIQAWQALSPEERLRRQWAQIPHSVAISMAFAGEPVDLAELEAEHARHPVPLGALKREESICATHFESQAPLVLIEWTKNREN